MSDLVFSSPAKREKFLKSIAFHPAKIAAKQAAKQLDFFGPPVDVNGAVPAVTAPAVPGQLVGLPKRTLAFPLWNSPQSCNLRPLPRMAFVRFIMKPCQASKSGLSWTT